MKWRIYLLKRGNLLLEVDNQGVEIRELSQVFTNLQPVIESYINQDLENSILLLLVILLHNTTEVRNFLFDRF